MLRQAAFKRLQLGNGGRPDEYMEEEAEGDAENGLYSDGEEDDEEAGERRKKEAKKRREARMSANAVLDPLMLSDENLRKQLSHVVDGTCDKLVWRAAEVREHMRMVWRKEGRLLRVLFPSLFQEVGHTIGARFDSSQQ